MVRRKPPFPICSLSTTVRCCCSASEEQNITPDKVPKKLIQPVLKACDDHLREVVDIMGITRIVGVGKYAGARLALFAEKKGLGKRAMGEMWRSPRAGTPVPQAPWPTEMMGRIGAETSETRPHRLTGRCSNAQCHTRETWNPLNSHGNDSRTTANGRSPKATTLELCTRC